MIELKENTSVKNIGSVYKQIGTELDKSDDVLLDFSRLNRLDLSVIQLIIAAARYAREQGKTIRLKSVSEQIRWQLEMCGIKT
ncbi:MAG TPA: STAS domain-containing protein [Spirochaetota bacterium]|nr:STAS domain-containing protein [Spirochaetota bacterium]HPI88267.1 STAS domain-containing protein [Spirochaetota bacterium]HPR50013.1 STAS domain-containing protein [Spirochaetota bacterium]